MCDWDDCFTCPYEDCVREKMTDDERKGQDFYDRQSISERATVEERKVLRKGALRRQYDYNHSDKGKEAQKRYENSKKGKATARRKTEKKIASGRNAEACRRYYLRKKAKKEELQYGL